MNNRLIAFIVMVVLATLTAFAQNDQIVSESVRDLSVPATPTVQQPEAVVVSETVRDLTVPTPPAMEEPKPVSAPVVSQAPTNGGNGVHIGLSADVRQKEALHLTAVRDGCRLPG